MLFSCWGRLLGHKQALIIGMVLTGFESEQIAAEYDLDVSRIREAQAFYNAHRVEIDANIRVEQELEGKLT